MTLASSVDQGHTLSQSTIRNRTFFMGVTGLTLTVTISKNGAAFAAAAGVVTELTDGWYVIALTTVDTNTLGDLTYHVTDGATNILDFSDQVIAPLLTAAGYTAPDNTSIAAVKAKTDNLPASPAAVGSAMTLTLSQAVATTGNVANSVGDCLNAARAQGFGKWVLDASAKTLVLYANDGTTVVRTFTLDAVPATSRS